MKRIKHLLGNRNKKVKKRKDGDVPLQSQIRALRALLLASIIVFTMHFIRFQNLYYQLLEKYQEVTEYQQEAFYLTQKVHDVIQEHLEVDQEILDIFDSVLGGMFSFPQENQLEEKVENEEKECGK